MMLLAEWVVPEGEEKNPLEWQLELSERWIGCCVVKEEGIMRVMYTDSYHAVDDDTLSSLVHFVTSRVL